MLMSVLLVFAVHEVYFMLKGQVLTANLCVNIDLPCFFPVTLTMKWPVWPRPLGTAALDLLTDSLSKTGRRPQEPRRK